MASVINVVGPNDVIYLLTWIYVDPQRAPAIQESYACKTRKSFDEQVQHAKADPYYHNIQGFEMHAVKVKI